MSGPIDIESKQRYRQQKERLIKKMLFLGHQMGYDKPDPTNRAEQLMDTKRLNWNNVERWCKSEKCAIRKTLNGYTVEELAKVVTQFELVYESFKKSYARRS